MPQIRRKIKIEGKEKFESLVKQKLKEKENKQEQQKVKHKYNEMGIRIIRRYDSWDVSLIGQSQCILMEGQNTIARTTMLNQKRWYNLFGTKSTESQFQYHWRIGIQDYHKQGGMFIGIMDIRYIDGYVQSNSNNISQNYFVKSKYAYGMDANGNLQRGGKYIGKACKPFSKGDIVDIYFDPNIFILRYGLNGFGLNGEKYGVAYKVRQAIYKCCIAIYGSKHCVELL